MAKDGTKAYIFSIIRISVANERNTPQGGRTIALE
jgi:hypothetical protein